MKRAVVCKDGRFLKLVGKFEYAEWTSFVQATQLSASKAAGWAAALGGSTLALDEPKRALPKTLTDFAQEHQQVPVPAEEAAPDTTRDSKRDSFDPHVGSFARFVPGPFGF